MISRIIVTIALTFACAGCATLFSDVHYPVTINSNPSALTIQVLRSTGQIVHRGTTPTRITLSSSKGYMQGETYTINLVKEGKVVGTTTLNSRIDGWFWGNFLHGGLIGMLVVDPLTGKMWTLDSEVMVSDFNAPIDPNELHVLNTQDLRAHQRKHLISLDGFSD